MALSCTRAWPRARLRWNALFKEMASICWRQGGVRNNPKGGASTYLGACFPFEENFGGKDTLYLIHFHIIGGTFHLLRYLGVKTHCSRPFLHIWMCISPFRRSFRDLFYSLERKTQRILGTSKKKHYFMN
jgi:hypothetical protein